MKSSYETYIGTIAPNIVNKYRNLESPLIEKFIVFKTDTTTYKGTVKWYGEINDIKAFGIETIPIALGTDGEFNNHKIFTCKSECGILIEESFKYLVTDELHGFVNYNEFNVDKKYINDKSRLVYVDFQDKYRIGRILNGGVINGIICFKIEIFQKSLEYYVIKNDILENFVNDDGIISLRKNADLNIENCNEDRSMIIDKRVRFRYNNEDEIGVLKWKGKIDGLKCIGVDPNTVECSNWTMHFNPNSYWTIICLDFLENKGISIIFEIEDPFNHDIFTYLKKNTYVKIKDDEGIITSYFTDKKNLFYEIKMDDGKIVIANCNNVKCGAVVKKENKSFVTMKIPDDHGVLTKFNINDYVEVKPDSENKLDKSCFGFLVWMGFDGDMSLRFLINLEYPNERASRGTFYGQKLHDIKNKHGLLVYPDCLIPFGHVPGTNSLYEINTGTTHPSKVIKLRSLKSPLIYKFIVFQIKSSNYKGTVKWFGEINDIRAFGIETDPIDMGTNGEFNNFKFFNYKPECGILIEESVKYLETDELHGFVKYNEFKVDKKYTNSKSRLVYVRFKNECRIGRILNGGFINEIICFQIKILKESIEYFVITEDLLDIFVNDDGIVCLRKDAVLNIEYCNEDFSLIIDKRVRFQYNNEDEIGLFKWKGKIDGLKCIGVEPHNAKLISDWKKYFNRNAYWTIICLDFLEEKGISIKFEIEDPFNHDIFTYLKKKTFVKIKGDDGIIKSYFTDKKNLFYEIKMDDGKIVIANCNNVTCGAVAKKENKSFVTMKSPDDHGVLTKFNINDYVEVKTDSENKLDKSCFGFLVWMGFDGDRSLRFLIKLEYPNERASSGTFFGQKLHDIKNKHGLLVHPDCLIPFGHVPGKNVL